MSAALISVFATPPPFSRLGSKLRSSSYSTAHGRATLPVSTATTATTASQSCSARHRRQSSVGSSRRQRPTEPCVNEVASVLSVAEASTFYTNGSHKCTFVLGWHIFEHVSLLDWIGMYILGAARCAGNACTRSAQVRRTRSTIWT
jgi:hypothetical protein